MERKDPWGFQLSQVKRRSKRERVGEKQSMD